MSEEELKEGNLIIGKWLGFTESWRIKADERECINDIGNIEIRHYPEEIFYHFPKDFPNPNGYTETTLNRFCYDWNWIMFALIKILSKYKSQCLLEHPGFKNINDCWNFTMLDDTILNESTDHEQPLMSIWMTIVNYLKHNEEIRD